ncbi:hypothetical protein [Mesorhizobium prunaredense]|uniref:hypothetical protein n=1 Tax=Mesorhizobium prunaredense TaxID=1631249 RepID=UPI00117D2E8E|nr:hypothetical protein [Mesorhizobium prunaredense]
MSGKAIGAAAGIAGLFLSGALSAAEIAIDCPADAGLPELVFGFAADTLSIKDASGTATLQASFHELSAGMFAIQAWGPTETPMPNLADMDRCLGDGLKKQDMQATDASAVTYLSNLCRLKLMPEATAQRIDAKYEITALDPKSATVFISRSYTVASSVTGEPLQLDEWPIRQCAVISGP